MTDWLSNGDDPEGIDWAVGVFIGALVSFVWPVFAGVLVAVVVSHRIWAGRWLPPFLRSMRPRDEHEVVP